MTDLSDNPFTGVTASPDEWSDRRLVLWHFSAALMLLVMALVAGTLSSLQFAGWHPFPGIPWLSAGRWQMIESTAAIYGFMTNAFLGSLHWIVPRITGKSVWSRAYFALEFLAVAGGCSSRYCRNFGRRCAGHRRRRNTGVHRSAGAGELVLARGQLSAADRSPGWAVASVAVV